MAKKGVPRQTFKGPSPEPPNVSFIIQFSLAPESHQQAVFSTEAIQETVAKARIPSRSQFPLEQALLAGEPICCEGIGGRARHKTSSGGERALTTPCDDRRKKGGNTTRTCREREPRREHKREKETELSTSKHRGDAHHPKTLCLSSQRSSNC